MLISSRLAGVVEKLTRIEATGTAMDVLLDAAADLFPLYDLVFYTPLVLIQPVKFHLMCL
jgi:hypothetical protein